MHQSFAFGPFALVVLAILWGGAIAFLLFLAGRNIRDLRGYWLAFTASILAMLPCHPAVIVTFPVGLWTLLVLLRPGMKAAFDECSAEATNPSSDPLPPGKELPATPRSLADRGLIESRVVWCARGLRISGWIDLIGWAGLAFLCVAETISAGYAPAWIAFFYSLWGVRLAAGALVLLGAHHLANMQLRAFAWLGAIVAIVPASPGWLVGLPCGVWAMFLLNRGDVQAEFARRQSLAIGETSGWRTWLAGAAMLAGLACSFGFLAVSTMGPRRIAPAAAYSAATSEAATPSYADYAYPRPPDAPAPFGAANFVEIDGVPQLDPYAAPFGILPEQEQAINEALREARREYLTLEDQHTSRSYDEDRGYRVITVAPLAAEVKNSLEDRFWSKIDAALVSDEQRREVRYRLKLNLIAPYQDGLHLEYCKVGSFYRWRTERGSGFQDAFREEPRLPNDLQRIVDADQATLVQPPSPE